MGRDPRPLRDADALIRESLAVLDRTELTNRGLELEVAAGRPNRLRGDV